MMKMRIRMTKIKSTKKLKIIVITLENFRGAAHNDGNLRYNESKNTPIVIHNTGYSLYNQSISRRI